MDGGFLGATTRLRKWGCSTKEVENLLPVL